MPLKNVAKRLAKRVAEGKNSITTLCVHLTFSTPWLLKKGVERKSSIITYVMGDSKMPDDSKMTQLQGQKLAELINALRPSWGTNGIFEAIGGAVTGNMGDAHEISLAAIRAARDPTNKTPAIIRLPGKHWSVEQDLADTRAELKAAKDRIAGKYSAPDTNDPWCEDHPDQRLSFCKECAKEKVPMPPNFRELAGIAPKLPRKRHRSPEQAEVEQESADNETKPGEGHAA